MDLEPDSLTSRALALVMRTPGGVVSTDAVLALGVSQPVACSALGRLYWAGLVDRTWDRGRYRYTVRPTPPCRT